VEERTHANGVVTRHFALADGGDLVAAVTTRFGGSSTGPYATCNLGSHVGDDPDRVRGNRDAVAEALGLDRLTIAQQQHGRRVAVVGEELAGAGHEPTAPDPRLDGVDALVTVTPGVALAVLAADCAPLVLVDPVRRVLGVAHAGRLGVVADVLAAVVQAMGELGGSPAQDLVVGIGPCIGATAYEIDGAALADVEAAFGGEFLLPTSAGRASFDLKGAVIARLEGAGVRRDRIEAAAATTDSDPLLFSDRAARPCGRFGVVAALRGPSEDPR
jgi:YfiH family protein